MGSKLSKKAQNAEAHLKQEAKNALLMSKLADIKQKKIERDTQIAMKIAVLRDRVHCLIGFYITMIAANAIRTRRFGVMDKKLAIGSFEPMPLAYFPYIATPFAFAYQADFAYGTKAERLNIEVQNILYNESHWFNKPIVLPKHMEAVYSTMMHDTNVKLAEIGEPPEKNWAIFTSEYSTEQLLTRAAPLSRLLHSSLA